MANLKTISVAEISLRIIMLPKSQVPNYPLALLVI